MPRTRGQHGLGVKFCIGRRVCGTNQWFQFLIGYQVKFFDEEVEVLVTCVYVRLRANLCHF